MLSRVLDFAKLYQAKVQCAHITIPSVHSYHTEILNKAYNQEITEGMLSFHQYDDVDLVQGLLEILNQSQIDLLVMCKHEKSLWDRWFGDDNIEKLRKFTPIPMWVLPNNGEKSRFFDLKAWTLKRPFAL